MLKSQINQKNVWYAIIGIFLDKGFRFELLVYNSCHDVLMMAFGLENIAILNFKGADYRCITWNLSRSDAINR